MKNRKDKISKIIGYIENHLSDNLYLEKLAYIANYSKYHLDRIFTSIVGCTIHQYVQKRRMTEAAKKLVYTDKPIIDIALAAGYESQQSFSSVFKKLYGESPQVYRKNKEFWPIQLRFIINSNINLNMKCEAKAA